MPGIAKPPGTTPGLRWWMKIVPVLPTLWVDDSRDGKSLARDVVQEQRYSDGVRSRCCPHSVLEGKQYIHARAGSVHLKLKW